MGKVLSGEKKIASKAYVKDYENIDSLKAAITAAFREVARKMTY